MNEENRHEELQALKRDILSSLHCALPGRVVSFCLGGLCPLMLNLRQQ